MPITAERVGLFTVQAHGRLDWYIVDPAQGDPGGLAEEYRVASASDSRGPARAITIAALLVAGALGGVAVGAWGFGARELGTYVTLVLAGIVAGALCVVAVEEWLFARPSVRPTRPAGVARLHPDIVGWSENDAPLQGLWELNRELGRTLEVQAALAHWGYEGFDRRDIEAPEGELASELDAFLRERLRDQQRRLAAVAEQLRFPVPSGY
jgi:hypothetical protein